MCVHCEGEHPIVMEAETQSKRVKYLAISGGHLFTANDWTAHGPLIRLNYCPMCGRDLRGDEHPTRTLDGEPPVTVPYGLAHMMVSSAVRYYMGRHTIAAHAVADGIAKLLPQLAESTMGVLERDLRRWLRETPTCEFGAVDDREPWARLLEAIEGEPC